MLFENRINDNRKYFGRDEYLNSFIVESDTNIVGKILDVKIVDFNHNTLFGDIINDKNIAA